MNVSKRMVGFGASLLFLTGSGLVVGVTNQTPENKQVKHERMIGGAGRVGTPERGNTTAVVAVATVRSTSAAKRPCRAHEAEAKFICLKHWKKQNQRARLAWPPNPTVAEIQSRIGMSEWHKAERVSVCETGGNWQHYPNGTYIGGMGMFRQTYGIGQAVTGYRWVSEGATKQEQIAVAHIVAQKFGWSAWGCGGA